MTAASLFWMALGGWLIAGLTATGAKVLRDFSRHEFEEYCRRRRNPKRMDQVLDDYEEVSVAVETLQVVGTAITVVAGFSWLQARWHDSDVHTASTVSEMAAGVGVGIVLLLAATVWLPWAIVQFASAPFLFHTWPSWRVIGWALWPLSLGARFADEVMQRLTGTTEDEQSEEEAFEDEIRSIVTEGLHEGHLEADAREMIEAVIELGDVDVADIMTPRSNVEAFDISSDWDDVVKFVTECGRTRIPVYEGKFDRIVGILYAKDLLPELSLPVAKQKRNLRRLLRKAWFVPKSKKADDLLRDFLRTHNHMAIVVDEFQANVGVVTIEDALEEIVGEIIDEYDEEEEVAIRQVDDHSAEILGAAHIDEINEHMGIDLPEEEEYDTIAGWVLTLFGRIPRRDEVIESGGVRIIVLDANRRKVEKVKLEVLDRARMEA